MRQVPLDTTKQKVTFINKGCEYIPFITVDCASMSPGAEFFRETEDGFRRLADMIPEHAEAFTEAATFYEDLAQKAPGPRGSLHPRGGAMFMRDRLDALDNLHSQLLDIADSLG